MNSKRNLISRLDNLEDLIYEFKAEYNNLKLNNSSDCDLRSKARLIKSVQEDYDFVLKQYKELHLNV